MTDYTYWHRSRAAFLAEMRLGFAVRPPNRFMTITSLSDGYPSPKPPTPLWTRHMLGVIEAERDQRRRRRKGR